MSWDPIWEETYRRLEWGKYPPEEVIRFVARNFYRAADRSDVRILELGCGPGNVIWYLAREGFAASGIDGAETAIERARRRLADEGLSAELHVGDFTRLDGTYGEEAFDAVLDVTSLQHNRLAQVEATLEQVERVLKPQGRVFSLAVARGSWGDGAGTEVEDGTYDDIAEGPLVDRGLTHFFSREEIERLFGRFGALEVNQSTRTLDHGRQSYTHWVVEAGPRA